MNRTPRLLIGVRLALALPLLVPGVLLLAFAGGLCVAGALVAGLVTHHDLRAPRMP